ncbi:MAG: glycosyltransferase family 4 protein, partial [Symploca sp. SIO2B6]|nr:glycosyltransferase family 4 protein [Symploca sp. SIO2B6]
MKNISVLHIIQQLSGGGAARSLLATARYSAAMGNFQHRVISLLPATDSARTIAQDANVEIIDTPNKDTLNQNVETADIVQVHFWNTPELYQLLYSPLPPLRLLVWAHVGGDKAPQIITPSLVELPDAFLASSPYTLDIPAIRTLSPAVRALKTGMVYDSTDFERLSGLEKQSHDTFNVGYVGTVDFVKMHPNFVAMSAAIDIPDVKFVVCGHGIERYLQQQAKIYSSANRFQFLGHVEDIKSVIQTFDVFGYPLCEDNYST